MNGNCTQRNCWTNSDRIDRDQLRKVSESREIREHGRDDLDQLGHVIARGVHELLFFVV